MTRNAQSAPSRVIIEGVWPEIDGGLFPVKRIVGEPVEIEADIFLEGADSLDAALLFRHESEKDWSEVRMHPLVNDRWRAAFKVVKLGWYFYTIQAWPASFESWRRFVQKKVDAGQDVAVELPAGIALIEQAAARAHGSDVRAFESLLAEIGAEEGRVPLLLDDATAKLVARYPDRSRAAKYLRELKVWVDPVIAGFSAWYEMFPRSVGTFRDCEKRLEYVSRLGFDVLYLPPIHPIGTTNRKGKNNSVTCKPGEPGSPWAIGSSEGGHKAVHSELGTLEDFREFVEKARAKDIEVALDIAFQCSPDHPWVREHPEWFRKRSDGSIRFAENPPKKYQDIYPIDFETPEPQPLWDELKSVFEFWIEQGVRIFRVDNPHTKPFAFWEWLIWDIKKRFPEVIFLSEAFTRPKVMYRLAKLGFSQSYTYFAWRNAKWELEQYFHELNRTGVSEFFRPNLWPNTPDILTEYLQTGGHAAFRARLLLAATLGANYGIYGPAFELCQHVPREPGSEEYLNSEKYEICDWDLARGDGLAKLITRVNRARRDNPAVRHNRTFRLHHIDNDRLICFSKSTPDRENVILVVVNLDPYFTQSGWTHLDLGELGVAEGEPFQVHDLIGDGRYTWNGPRNYIEINPHVMPGHLFRIRKRVRTEHDFSYFT